jgi:hypothetical protein
VAASGFICCPSTAWVLNDSRSLRRDRRPHASSFETSDTPPETARDRVKWIGGVILL